MRKTNAGVQPALRMLVMFVVTLFISMIALSLFMNTRVEAAPPDANTGVDSFDLYHQRPGFPLVKSDPESIDSEAIWRSGTGDIAYCLSEGRPSPTTPEHGEPALGAPMVGPTTVTATGGYVDRDVAWILENGYPTTQVFDGVMLDEREARQATQVALWLANDGDSGKKPGGWDPADIFPTPGREGAEKTYAAILWLHSMSQDENNVPFHRYKRYTLDGSQGTETQWMTLAVPVVLEGGIELQKGSGAPHLTDGNDAYDLSGAVYEVRDAADVVRATLTTDASGHASAAGLPFGTYTVTEKAPPRGYQLDPTAHSILVDGVDDVLMLTDVPQVQSIDILLRKYDEQTGVGAGPQGSATLEGARFAVRFYGGVHPDDPAASGIAPLRSWVFQTDGEGLVRMRNADATFTDATGIEQPYLVSGDPLYTDDSGAVVFPMGTITIQEISAPQGYLMPSDPPVFIRPLEGGSDTTYLAPEVPDTVERGDLSLMKFGERTNGATIDPDTDPEVKVPLAGVSFSLINTTGHDVIAPDGSRVPDGSPVLTITTDEQGFATTEGLHAGGALPYGTYRLVEDSSTTPPGFSPVADVSITVDARTPVVRLILEDMSGTALKLVKVDADTGEVIAGRMTFRIEDAEGAPVVFTIDHPVREEIVELATSEEGTIVLPRKLAAGTYRIVEIAAPLGYARSVEPIEFTVGSDTVNTFDDPLEIRVANAPQQGEVVLSKTDRETGERISGDPARFDVRAATDIITPDGTVRAVAGEVVDTMSTDAEGIARSTELYLGSYDVVEVEPPTGYVVDPESFRVEVTADPEEVVNSIEVTITNEPNSFTLLKTDAASDHPLAGAVFELERDGYPEPRLLTTDDNGVIRLDRLAPDTYTLTEIEPPAGYFIDPLAEPIVFTVAEDGTVEGEARLVRTVTNDRTHVRIIKSDAADGSPLAGAELALLDEQGAVVHAWTSTAEPHLLEGIPPGTYTLREESAPEGYLLAEDMTITIEAIPDVQVFELLDERIPPLPQPEPTPVPAPTAAPVPIVDRIIPRTGDDGRESLAALGLMILGIGALSGATRLLRRGRSGAS